MTIKPQAKDIHTDNIIAVICFDLVDFNELYPSKMLTKIIISGGRIAYSNHAGYAYQAVYEVGHICSNEYIKFKETERAKENPNYTQIKECIMAGLTKK